MDHPGTQAVKTATIQSIFGTLQEHVAYVPVVFGEDRLDKKLLDHGHNPGLKTLFIVEGLLTYIPPPAVDLLLAFIASASGPGSAIVADYFDTSVIAGTSPLQEARALKQFVEAEGALLKFGIPEDEAETFFTDRGFSGVS